MEDTIYQTKAVVSTYSPKEKLIHLCWNSEANTHEYRKIFQFLIDFIKKRNVRYVVSDIRKEGLVSIDDLKWLEEEIFKKYIHLGVEKIALIIEDSIFSNVYAETIKRKFTNNEIEVRLFDSLKSANNWMKDD